MNTMTTIFWLSAFAIFYAYAGYPLLIWLIASLTAKKRRRSATPYLPVVSLLISAYNEENMIEDKIINSLSLDYPKELLEIMIVSDGSNDRTTEIAKNYENRGVCLRHFEGRIGKTACLNKVVPLTRGDLIVFSDGNSMYDKNAVKNLVANFTDAKVGFVTGYTRYATEPGDDTSTSIGLYSQIEKFTKKTESRIGSCVGADGALFAIRKHLYTSLKDSDINDFVIPLQVIRQGFKGVFEENAFCTEKSAGDPRGEFQRQIRITNRTLRALMNNIALLNPLAYGIFSFELFSHKVAKFSSPFFVILLVLSTVVLASSGGAGYQVLLMAEAALFLLALSEYGTRSFNRLSRLSSISSTFVIINLAIMGGWLQFIKGETYTTWSPVKRHH